MVFHSANFKVSEIINSNLMSKKNEISDGNIALGIILGSALISQYINSNRQVNNQQFRQKESMFHKFLKSRYNLK
jgi:hypothetical protein